MSYSTPIEYRCGIPDGNSIASGGMADHFVIKRWQPNNGTDFKLGSRVNFKLADSECLLHPEQMYLKWIPEAQEKGKAYSGSNAFGAISGQTSSIKTVNINSGGKNIETIMNYNKYCAQESINAPLEHKVYLAKTEGLTGFSDGKMLSDNRRAFLTPDTNGKKYAIHQLQTGLSRMSALELALIPQGIDLELVLTTDINEPYPESDTIDNQAWKNVSIFAVMTRPADGFWSKQASDLQKGKVIPRPIQTVRHQSYQPTNSSSFVMTVDSGIVKSVSSVLVCGNDPDRTDTDKLNFSSDLNIRSIYFTVAGKRVPENGGISYSKTDPELYVLGFRGRQKDQISFVPSTYLFDNEGVTGEWTGATPPSAGVDGNRAVRGWQFRFDMRDALSGFADGLSTLTGSFQINVSTVPEGPDYLLTAPEVLKASKSFDLWYVTDQVLEISANGLRLTPVW